MREMAACPQAGLIGCTQVTEINGTSGVELVALLPVEFELATDYALGVCTGAEHPEQTRVLAAMLSGPASASIRRRGGFEFGRVGLGLATLVNFVSHAVVLGFTAGAAVLIAASQLKNFFGIDIVRASSVYRILLALGQQVTPINPWVTTVAGVTVRAGVLTRRRWPKAPYLIVARVAGGIVAALLDLVLGSKRTLIGNVGALNAGLPPLSYPPLSPGALEQLAPVAIAVTLLSLTEAISVARAIAVKSGQVIDANQGFVGQGLSNLAGTFFSGAAVRCGAHERQRLEQLCRTITRPALANERVQINSAAQVVLKLRAAWRDATTHIVMSPLEVMQRLAALVPRPRRQRTQRGEIQSAYRACIASCLCRLLRCAIPCPGCFVDLRLGVRCHRLLPAVR